MEYFFRSLKYLKPYRGRLAVSVVCVVLIAVLWGGGLGMIAPVMKVMIDPEGLHGWAWRSLIQDRLEVRIVQRPLSSRVRIPFRSRQCAVASVIDVVDVTTAGPADRAPVPVRPGDWIVGIADGIDDHAVMAGGELATVLADLPDDRPVTLYVYRQDRGTVERSTITLGTAGFGSKMLGRIARVIPPPRTYADRFSILVWMLAVVVVLTVLRDILRFVQEYIVQSTVWHGIMDLRCDNYNAALRLPVTFYATHGTSDTMSRFIQDTGDLARGQMTLFGKTLAEPAKAVGSLATALLLSWKLTLLAMVAGPPAFVLIRLFGKFMKRAARRALESWSAMLAVLGETLSGIRVVKTYTMESTERGRFFDVSRRLFKQQRRMSRIDAATSPIIETMGVTAGMTAAGIGGYWVLHGKIDPFIFLTWLGCLAGMFDPVRKLAKVFTRFQRADAAAKRIFDLQDQPQEKRVEGAVSLPRHAESLEFRNVSYRYAGAGEDAIRDVSLTITAGRTVAIVGPNGCGKTTLISLIPRLLDPSAGAVLIDGQDISQCSLRSLRRQIGFVTQDTVLFNATIGENIAYGLRRPREGQILDAAKKAFVDEFVREMPNGYDTMVGEHGATLSGGQKQRITIARAILRDPAILIFDEATSQIDPDSEQRIHQTIKEFVRGRTTLMIAHRFTTILSADRIVVMDEGRIIDQGAHGELLRRCALYGRLFKQFHGEGE